MILGSRNPNRELSSIFELAFDVWSSDDSVEPPNLCSRFEDEIPCQHRNEHLHLQESKSPSDT